MKVVCHPTNRYWWTVANSPMRSLTRLRADRGQSGSYLSPTPDNLAAGPHESRSAQIPARFKIQLAVERDAPFRASGTEVIVVVWRPPPSTLTQAGRRSIAECPARNHCELSTRLPGWCLEDSASAGGNGKAAARPMLPRHRSRSEQIADGRAGGDACA